MKKMRPYKGYTATVVFDADEMLLHGRVENLRDVVTFHATDVADVQREFEAAVDDYLELCEERGEEPDRPFSGRFVLRLEPEDHRSAAAAAERGGLSLNAWIERAVRLAIAEEHQQRASSAHLPSMHLLQVMHRWTDRWEPSRGLPTIEIRLPPNPLSGHHGVLPRAYPRPKHRMLQNLSAQREIPENV